MKNVSINHQPSFSAKSSITEENEYVYSTNHALDVNITGDVVVGDIDLQQVGGVAITLGQKTMAASLPITIASDQSAIPVSQSGTWNINNISGTISLPTGAANQTKQDTGNTSLASIDGKTPALGQALAAGSVPVVLTAAQISTLTPLATVAATQSGNWSTRTLDGSGNSIGSTGGALNVNISSGNITGFATASNQTSGAQLTQIVDAGGDAVTVTGGKLDVNATISGSGGGTSSIDKSAFTTGSDTGTPAMGIYQSSLDTISSGDVAVIGMTPKRGLFVNLQTAAGTETGVAAVPLQVSLANTGSNSTAVKVDGSAVTQPVSGTFWQATQPVSGTVTANIGTTGGLALAATQTDKSQFTKITDGTDTALITGSGELNVISTAQPGVDIGDVTVNNGSGAAAVNIQDGGNSITVDYATTGSGTATGALRVELPTNGTGVVGLNAGTNAIGKLTANSGVIIGDVNVVNSNVSTNLAQVNGATTLAGNGASGTGAQRVTIASDSTGQVAPAANATATGTAIYNNTALSSTKQAVNASAGNLYGYHIYNPNSVVIYIQMFNLASASVTVGSTAPTAVIAIPAGGWADATPGVPITFGTALTIAATTTSTGSGSPTTALLCNIWYK